MFQALDKVPNDMYRVCIVEIVQDLEQENDKYQLKENTSLFNFKLERISRNTDVACVQCRKG